MRKLTDVANTDAPSSDFPKGRVRDKNGAIVGTTYSEVLHGDIIQLFQKLVIDSSLTENDLPDNVTNGYQLLTALNEKIKQTRSASASMVSLEANTLMDVSNPLITIAAEPFERMIYITIGGGATPTFDATIEIAGDDVMRVYGFGASACILLPANTVSTINWITSTGGVNVKAQQIGL